MSKAEQEIYIEDAAKMLYDELREIYDYCLLHANKRICRDNLNTIRHLITARYFNLSYDTSNIK
jgi:hypothetical protein